MGVAREVARARKGETNLIRLLQFSLHLPQPRLPHLQPLYGESVFCVYPWTAADLRDVGVLVSDVGELVRGCPVSHAVVVHLLGRLD